MIARRLHHASFPVSNLARAMDFYGRVLGLEQIERPALPFPGAWYGAGECEIHLIVPFEGTDIGRTAAQLNPLAVHTAFEIDDYAAVRERFQREGIEVLETGAEIGQMWVRDPDGNIIELIVDKRRERR
jgi:catechol 2,3-dioxygenase-like lactoylglutathione lyase family enzyme